MVEIFIATGLLFNYSILFVSLQNEFDSSAVLTGWVGSLANLLIGCGSPISASIITRYGSRMVVVLGAVMYSAGVLATSFVPDLAYAYLTFGVIAGLGANFIFQAGIVLIIAWFTGTSSRGTSLALLGSSFGVLGGAPLLNALIAAYGWRNTLRIVSGGSLVLALAHGAFLTEPKSDQTPQDVTIDDIQFKTMEQGIEEKPDGGQKTVQSEEEAQKTFHTEQEVRRTLQSEQEAHKTSQSEQEAQMTLQSEQEAQKTLQSEQDAQTLTQKYARLVRQIDAWLWFVSSVLFIIGLSFVIINFASFMEYDLHFTSEQISITFVLFAVGEISGKILLSVVGDLFPFQKLYVLSAGIFLGGAVSGLMTVLRTVPLIYTLTFFSGLSRAICFAMPFPAAVELFGDYGSDIATVLAMFPFGVGVLIGAPLSGGLYDLTGDYTLSLLALLGMFTLSGGLMLLIPIRRRITSCGLPESTVES
ncbi:monocarboxylate transporter 13-like [Asterias rubens]|uniref:monocarboxylate transporter 13-like n=1 Tax=Asterias rubens TaxID=7604 RepID=UPI001455986B|nr:monocarboxylate transporter 13-like [Asterias rubens]